MGSALQSLSWEDEEQTIEPTHSYPKQQKYKLIHAYIRQQNISFIPRSIIEIIADYYPARDLSRFSWNKWLHGIDLYFVDDQTVATESPNAQWTSCCSKQVITSIDCDYYEYVIQILHWDYIKTGIGLGVASKDMLKDNDWSSFIGNNGFNFMVRIHGSLHEQDHFTYFDIKHGVYRELENIHGHDIKFKRKDRIKIGVDFRRKCLKIYYNDKYINSLYDGYIPNDIVFVASLWCAKITVNRLNYE